MSPGLLSSPGGTYQQGIHMADKYLVAYAKITLDKDDGISLAGVFIGGIGDSKEEADIIARDVVNTVPRGGGTIIPRVTKLVGDGQVIDAVISAGVGGKGYNLLFAGRITDGRIDGNARVSDGDSYRTLPWKAARP